MSRHRLFDSAGRGADYIADCLNLKGQSGADRYEMGKFGWVGAELTLSESLLGMIRPRGSSAIDNGPLKNPHGDKKAGTDGTAESKNGMIGSGTRMFSCINRGQIADGGGVCRTVLRMVSVACRGGSIEAQYYYYSV